MSRDEIQNVWFADGRYAASEVTGLLDRIARELDSGRLVGPLIKNATFQMIRGFTAGYDTCAVDWFLAQICRREERSELARMSVDPWHDLAVENYFAPTRLDGPAAAAALSRQARRQYRARASKDFAQECAEAWRDFRHQPGTYLSCGVARRSQLCTDEQETVVSYHRFDHWPRPALSAGGRAFSWKQVGRSAWPGLAETISPGRPGAPAHMPPGRESQAHSEEFGRDLALRQLVDEAGTPILYHGGRRHIGRHAAAYLKFPGHRWLRFPVRGTSRSNAIMTAVDEAGNKVARYRLITEWTGFRTRAEITVHPGQQLTDELALALVVSAPWLDSYFGAAGGGG